LILRRRIDDTIMPHISGDAGDIYYSDKGAGDGVVLIHGFAASADENWVRSGWVNILARAQRRVVTIDLRGHGQSVRSHDPAHYSIPAIASDVSLVCRHLGLKKPDLIGFSLGARVVLDLLGREPEAYLLGVLCGAGGRWLEPPSRDPNALAAAFEAEDAETAPDDMARRFRAFADAQGQDRLALAAVARGLALAQGRIDPAALGAIRNEVLVVAGKADDLAGDPAPLAAAMGRSKSVQVPGCGHMDCLVQPMFKGAVMDFLSGVA
jgi:pimeloyl-ACP methyl ester carboxylesterase